MWKKNFDKDKHCPLFLENPEINPVTGRKIQIHGDVHNWLSKMCTERVVVKDTVLEDFVKETRKMSLGKLVDKIKRDGRFVKILCKGFQKNALHGMNHKIPYIIFSFGNRKFKVSSTGPISEKIREMCKCNMSPCPKDHSPPVLSTPANFCKTRTMKNIRNIRKAFQAQEHQKRILNFLQSNDRLLLYHGLGSGKTCSSAVVISDFLEKNPDKLVYLFSPGGLRQNFMEEMCTFCPVDRRQILRDSIPHKIRLLSLDDSTLHKKLPSSFTDCLVVIDEAHRMIDSVSKDIGNAEDENHQEIKNLSLLYKYLMKTLNMKLLLLTGTPMPDSLRQHYSCLKLLNGNRMENMSFEQFENMFTETDGELSVKNQSVINLYKNIISYHVSPSVEIPSVTHETINIDIREDSLLGNSIVKKFKEEKKTQRTPFDMLVHSFLTKGLSAKKASQLASMLKYKSAMLEYTSRLSNIMYIDNSYPKPDLDDKMLEEYTLEEIWEVAPKLKKLTDTLNDRRKCPGKQLIYCPFKETEGVNLIGKLLTKIGITNRVYSGDLSAIQRSNLLQKFNAVENDNGERIKILLITDAAAEGISLLNVRGVHLCNESIYASHMNQVIGRAVRFRSHDRLPSSDRNVRVFRYHLRVLLNEQRSNEETYTSADETNFSKAKEREKLLEGLDKRIKNEWCIEKNI